MTNTEKELVKIWNEIAGEEIFVPEEIEDGIVEIMTYPFEIIMSDPEDPFGREYTGPEIASRIVLSHGEDVISTSACFLPLEKDLFDKVREYSERLEAETGDVLIFEEDEGSIYLECSVGLIGGGEGWEDKLLEELKDDEAKADFFNVTVFSSCYRMMDHVMTLADN